MGITWTDVRAAIPLPVQAHDAAHNQRRVEARLWRIPARERTYLLEFQLLDKDSLVETWANDYDGHRVHDAVRGYRNCMDRAERWLEGWPLANVRPRFSRRGGGP